MINARSETAWRKPSFRHAMQQRRAIIPVNGFYEWQRRDGAKKPYYITGDDRVLAVAGLYAIDKNGEMRCCVLTRSANEAIQPVHDRMPVTVSPGSVEPRLNGDRDTVDALIETSYRQAWYLREVSSFVNNSRNDGPECMAPSGGNGQLF